MRLESLYDTFCFVQHLWNLSDDSAIRVARFVWYNADPVSKGLINFSGVEPSEQLIEYVETHLENWK